MSTESDIERCHMLVRAQNRRIAEPRHRLEMIKKEMDGYAMDMTEEAYAELRSQREALEEELERIRCMSPAELLTLEEYETYLRLERGGCDGA